MTPEFPGWDPSPNRLQEYSVIRISGVLVHVQIVWGVSLQSHILNQPEALLIRTMLSSFRIQPPSTAGSSKNPAGFADLRLLADSLTRDPRSRDPLLANARLVVRSGLPGHVEGLVIDAGEPVQARRTRFPPARSIYSLAGNVAVAERGNGEVGRGWDES